MANQCQQSAGSMRPVKNCQNRFGIGRGLLSSEVLIKSSFQLPGSPSATEAMCVTAQSITLTWASPSNDGGAEILGYIVERKQAQSQLWIPTTPQMITATMFVQQI